MSIAIVTIGGDRLGEYASVPMVCEVRSMLAVGEIGGGMDGASLDERAVQVPYIKDYDAYSDGGPQNWAKRFDISTWGIWIGADDGEVVGGAAVAWNTQGLEMLEGRNDLAVLWDIRVRDSSRRRGLGTALFRKAAKWAKSKGCQLMKIETQNVNVSACRFYAAMGCFLGRIDREAYREQAEVAGEVMLVWHLNLLGAIDGEPGEAA